TNMDGTFGRSDAGAVYSPTAGGVVGLVKTAEAEWKGLNAKALDVARTMSPQDVADAVVEELRHPCADLEIGYAGAGERFAFRTQSLPHDGAHQGLMVQPDWVVLITGGARGITDEIAEAMAVPGARFILAGRTPIAAEESPETARL